MYKGPIKIGMKFIWAPNSQNATEYITVLQLLLNGEEAWIQSVDDTRRVRCWNSEDLFRESVLSTKEAFTELVHSKLLVTFAIKPDEFRINWAGPRHEAVMHVGKRIYTTVFELDLSTCDNDLFNLTASEVAVRLDYEHTHGSVEYSDGSDHLVIPPAAVTIPNCDGLLPDGSTSERIQFKVEQPESVITFDAGCGIMFPQGGCIKSLSQIGVEGLDIFIGKLKPEEHKDGQ